jgi:hypothetical protein
MRSNAFNKRLATLEERVKPRMISTLADFVVWRAKWRRGIMEEVEIDPVLEEGLRRFVEHSHGGENLEA